MDQDGLVAFLIVSSICIACLFFIQSRANAKAKRREFELQRLIDGVRQHRPALTRNLERAVITNDYGAIVQDNTYHVFDEFFASIVFNVDIVGFDLAVEKALIEIDVGKITDLQKGFNPATIPTDGFEFEHWVAENLNQFGWDAKATSGSGDQGIDVIAKKNGKTVGLQCKLFSSPVGNKAVQEAHAGKAFHQMDVVGVISNASYTKSAKALATDTGVKLLSHHDIPNLYEKMFSE